MKKIVLFLLIINVQLSAEAQNVVYHDFLNDINNLLMENNLKKTNMTAQDFNIAGMFFYEKKLWNEAELMFFRAIQIDRKHILANYNLACVLAIRYNENYSSKHPEILEFHRHKPFLFLNISVILDPSRKARARNDPDFNNMRIYEHDKKLFDEITREHPSEENPQIKYLEVIYKGTNSFEGDIRLKFTESPNDYWELSFNARDEMFINEEIMNLYSMSESNMYAIDNEKMIGGKFGIEIIPIKQYSDYLDLSGNDDNGIITVKKIISIKKLE